MSVIAPRLTLITDTNRYPEASLFAGVEQALSGGVDAVLVREKQLTSAKLLALASRLRQMTRAAGARLIIHTQVDVALAVAADGVHLASTDIASVAAVRQWLANPNKTVSVSCHSAVELDAACENGADYAMLSPVFATASHPGAAYLGINQFNALAAAAPLPVIALGGIDPGNCKLLQGRSMAVISALLGASNPALAAQQLFASSTGGRP